MLLPCQGRGAQCLSQQHLRVQGGLTLYRTPSFTGLLTLSHAHSDQDKVGTANWPNCTSLGCGWKLESPEKTHTHGENVQTTQTVALAGNLFFSPSSTLHHNYIIQESTVYTESHNSKSKDFHANAILFVYF